MPSSRSRLPALLLLLFVTLEAGAQSATGDFDGDGADELLMRHPTDAAWAYYDIEDGIGTRHALSVNLLEADRFVAVGDLNGDGRDDILMRTHDTHEWSWFLMGEGAAERRELRALTRNPLFIFQAAGDFTGDGRDDVLLRNSRSGQFIYYETRLGAAPPPAILHRSLGLTQNLLFDVISVGDLNGDGHTDVLLRHAHRGHWILYEMSRERGVLRRPGITQNLLFEFTGIGDLDGDGDDDIMLRHIGNGEWIHYAMSGGSARLVRRFGMPSDLRHDLVAIADFDGDGRGTALLRHPHAGDWIAYEVGTTQSERLTVSGLTTDLAWAPTSEAPTYDPGMFCAGNRTPSYMGYVAGFSGNADGLQAVLAGPTTLQVARPNSTGCFAFHAVPPGEYAIKINADGHQTPTSRLVTLPFRVGYDADPYTVEQLTTDPFTYHWEEDQTTPAGAEYSSHVVQPRVVEFQGATVDLANPAAAEHLQQDYNILLVGEEWSQEHAFRLLTTMRSIPQPFQDPGNNFALPASAWELSNDFIDGDIIIDKALTGTRAVTISSAAFVNATPRIATVDGRRGVWFSRRLHHAAVRFVTDNGHDESAYERIFEERYGLTTHIDDYWSLTSPTGHESHHNFQRFHAEEILLLINMLEEMPAGMQKLDGMRYLVRRLNGLEHPFYPGAPAVAWPQSEYVEFMESAFQDRSEDYIHRLIIHEKAHFLWAHVFDERLKQDWADLGGWYEDSSVDSGWSTTKSAEFVSAYAHAINPNEDMAETISYFIVNPDRLRARSAAKYDFVRDRIMQGDLYVARIREDLTFAVYNLFPDYVYPGKIRAIDIAVAGAPHDDKNVTVDIKLHALDEVLEGAHRGLTRIHSEVGTFFDLYLYPIDEHGNYLPGSGSEVSTRLRGEKTISKYTKAGYWLSSGITLRDTADNERYAAAKDYGWRMHVHNPLEDYTPPEYVPGTLAMRSFVSDEDETVQIIRVTWSFEEDTALINWRCDAYIVAALSDTYSYAGHGPYDDNDVCSADLIMPNYMPSSTYSTVRIGMTDVATNRGEAIFTGDDATEPPASIELVTTNPDTEPPEIDINRISVDAEPTNPTAPNGETKVTVRLRYRDNISGVTGIYMYLRDPHGGMHHYGVHPEEGNGVYPREDPTNWRSIERVVILPPGSIPGIWGIAEINVEDRAKNLQRHNFVEIVHFEVEGA